MTYKVFIDCEYGRKYFLWETTEDPVQVFHSHIPKIGLVESCMDPSDVLPGILTETTLQLQPEDVTHFVSWHEADDSYILKL